jgi:hypothetical protein
MSISALNDFGNMITELLGNQIVDQLQNASLVTLTITKEGVATSMHRTLTNQGTKVRGDIPTIGQIKRAVAKESSFIEAGCTKLAGAKNTSGDIGTELKLVLWAGPSSTTARHKNYKSVEMQVVPKLKEIFYAVLKNTFGPGGSHKSFGGGSKNRRLNMDSFTTDRDPTIKAGKASWRSEFSLSHKPGSTRAQQSAGAIREAGRAGKRDADIDADFALPNTEAEYKAKGRADFYEAVENKFTHFISPSLKGKINQNLVTVILKDGSTTKLHGLTEIELEFDDRDWQTAVNAKFDKPRLKRTLNKVINKERNKLVKKLRSSPKFTKDLWKLKGSPSRKQVYESAIGREVVGALTKNNKNVKVVKKAKPVNAKGGKGKLKTNRKPKKGTTRKTANLSPGVVAAKAVRGKQRRPRNKTSMNPIGLQQLLNKALPEEVAKNMGPYPRKLEYRTGRFAQSAQITQVVPMPNSVEIRYDYMQNPYSVFEPESGSPLASPGRDPRKIIGGTIRELAQSIMGTKYGLVRTKRV